MKDKPKDIRELLTAESIAAYREHVIEECARVAFETANVDERQKVADAICALKDKP